MQNCPRQVAMRSCALCLYVRYVTHQSENVAKDFKNISKLNIHDFVIDTMHMVQTPKTPLCMDPLLEKMTC